MKSGNKTKTVTNKPAERKTPFLPVFAFFIILFLQFFLLTNIIDYTVMPRFTALAIFLTTFGTWYYIKNQKNNGIHFLKPALIPVILAMLFVIAGSMFFSINVKEGLFDLLKWLLLLGVVIFATELFTREADWAVIPARFAVIASLIAVVIGLVQFKLYVIDNPVALLPDGRPTIYKVEGAQSHKNLFSLSLFMLTPWIGYGIFRFKGAWRMITSVSLALTLLIIVLLQTRAVWLGIMVAVPVALFFYLFFRLKRLIYRIVLTTAGILILTAASILFTMFASGQIHSENQYIRQLASIADPTSRHNMQRIKTWSLTLEMIRDHPVTGVGAGNWQIVSPWYYPGKFNDKDELNWIRPHNDYLWVFAEKGILGILLFLTIFFLTGYYLVKTVLRGTPNDRILALALLWGLTGYMVASFFDFPYERPWHMAMLGLTLAGAIALRKKYIPGKPPSFAARWFMIPLLLSFLIVSVYGIAVTRQEAAVRKSLDYSLTGNWPQMLKYGEEARSMFRNLDPWANPIQSYIGKGFEETNRIPEAIRAYEAAHIDNPTKLKVIMNLARAYEKSGMLAEAENTLNKGLWIIPAHRLILKQKSDVYYRMGAYDKAIRTYQEIYAWEQDSAIVQNIRYLRAFIKNPKP